jgi:hypothetical protein
MKRLIAFTVALSLTGCATYTNPVTGEQEVHMTQDGADALAAGLVLGLAAAGAAAAQSTPYMRVEKCSSRGCSTTRYYRR